MAEDPHPESGRILMHSWKLPVFATLAYILAGSSWILFGNFLTTTLYPNDAAPQFELIKGLIFVGITGTVLFIALTYLDRRTNDNLIAGDLGVEFDRSLISGDFVVRWLPALVVVLYSILFIIIAAALWSVRDHTLQNGLRSALALQKAHAALTSSSLGVINFTLSDIAEDIIQRRMSNPAEELRAHIPNFVSSVNSIGITDATGKVTAHTDSNATKLDLSSRDYFLFHRNNPNSGFHLTAPFRGEASGRWVIVASRPVRTASGEFMGIVAAVIDPAIFGVYWRQTTDAGTTLSIYDSNDTLMLRSPFHENAVGKSNGHALSTILLDQAASPKTFRAESLIDGENRIYAVGVVPEYPQLRLLVGLSELQLLKSWHTFAVVSLAIYLLIASGLTALTFVLLRQLRERLVLQRKAAQLARYPLQNRNPVLTVTSAGKKMFMNKAARQLYETSKGPVAEQLEQQLKSMAAETTPGLSEFTLGTQIWSASYVPHAPDYCDIYLTDVSATRLGENLLQLFFDLPFIGMAITSAKSKHWLRVNDQLCEILGYSRIQLQEKTWAELTHPDDLAADVAEFDRVMRDVSDGYSLDKRFIRADGAVVEAVIDVKAVRRPDRSVEYFLATIQDITERKHAERRLREQRNLYAALTATNESMMRLRERGQLFHRVCEVAVERAGLEFAWIGLVDTAQGVVVPVARHGDGGDYIDNARISTNPDVPEGRGPTGRMIASGEHQIVNDIFADPTMLPWHKAARHSKLSAMAVFPIRQDAAIIAVLYLYSRDTGFFSNDITKLIDEMVANLSFALDKLNNEAHRSQVVAELERVESRLQHALQGGEHGVWEWNAQNNEVYFSPVWKVMLGYTDAEIGNSFTEWESRVHPDDLPATLRELQRFSSGETATYTAEYRLRCKDGVHKWILDRGKAITRTADGKPQQAIGTHTDITAERNIREQLGESEAKFKGLVEQTLVGIYIADDKEIIYANPRMCDIFGYRVDEMIGKPFHQLIIEEDLHLVTENLRLRLSKKVDTLRYEFRGRRRDGAIISVGVHGSQAIIRGRNVVVGVLQDITERHLNEERVREYVARLEKSIMSTVGAISHMVDLRDPYTSGHERRVGELAAAIGSELGLTEHQITGLRVAGGVHDVGKIAVPAEILSKPTRLSAAEFAIVKTHAQQGYEILQNIDFPWPIAQTVWQHHERLDGSGYPRGLRGDDICLEARILAVADVVESMSTHRPYRPAMGIEAALAEVQAKTGVLYDSTVVTACIRLFREKDYQFTE